MTASLNPKAEAEQLTTFSQIFHLHPQSPEASLGPHIALLVLLQEGEGLELWDPTFLSIFKLSRHHLW